MENLKTLHRIYFGFDDKPDIYLDYLETWKKKLPEYEIKMWNKDNLPFDLNNFTKQFSREKNYVMLSDYFRWWILSMYGGIYLDGDIEIINGEALNKVITELENSSDYHSIIGIELNTHCTYTAHSVAAKKNSPLATFMCSVYENMGVFKHLGFPTLVAPRLVHFYFIENNVLKDNDSKKNGFAFIDEPTIYAGVKIYPKDYFSPLSIGEHIKQNNGKIFDRWYITDYTENTSICHHYSNSYDTKRLNYKNRKQIFFEDYKKSMKHDNSVYANKKKYFFEYIFSIAVADGFVLIYLLGIKIKIKRKL